MKLTGSSRTLGLFGILLGSLMVEAADLRNVLFIAVDDLRVELGCYGSPQVHSPHMDRLAKRGLLFERAYCQQSVCNPSRASLLTGRYPDTLRVWDLPTHFRVHHPDVITLPQAFKQQGWFTRCVGKIFHNWRQDEWKGDPASWSVPSVLHYNSHSNDKPQVEGEVPPNLASGKGGIECRDVPDEAYFDGRVARTAIEALQELSGANQPFFLAVGFWKPHMPFNAPKRYWDLYDRDKIPVPERILPPVDVPELALTPDRYRGGADASFLREMHHGHLAAISYLDSQVGRVLQALRDLDLEKNTVVVFWSDHGLHLGEHGLTRKTTVFELDAGVPLILSVPGMPQGGRSSSLVELVDLFPTLLDLFGQPRLEGLEGRSLVPILKDPSFQTRSTAMTQTPRPNYLRGKQPEVMGYSIRTATHRFTQWREWLSGKVLAQELYDHRIDPGETRNLAAKEEHRSEVNTLNRVLLERVPIVPHQP